MSENYVAPGQQRYLRACMVCSIVMTFAVSFPRSNLNLNPHFPPFPRPTSY